MRSWWSRWGGLLLLLGIFLLGGAVAVWLMMAVVRESSPGQGKSVPELIVDLGGRGAGQRRQAARALAERGPDAQIAVPALRAVLTDPDVRVRLAAAAALWRIDRDAEPAFRVTFCEGASRGRPTGPDSAEPAETSEAPLAEILLPVAFGSQEDAEQTVLAVSRVLDSPNPCARLWAATSLGQLPPESRRAAVPALIQALRDEDWRVRLVALPALGEMGPDAREAIPLLSAILRGRPHSQVCAAAAVFDWQPWDAVLLPFKVQLAEGVPAAIYDAAANALKQIDPEAAARAGVR